MKLRKYLSALFVAALLFFIPAMAVWSGTVIIPQTGQSTCWDAGGSIISCSGTGQDGDIKAGAVWPNPRFTNADGSVPVSGNVILDQLTGLMWPQNATATAGLTWTQALDYVAGMNSGAHPNYGYTDWRLPNIIELDSLYNAQQMIGSTWLGTQGFGLAGSYSSSTTVASYTTDAWALDTGSGYVGANSGKTQLNNYVPFRTGNQTATALRWATGQTTSYYSGDDGASKKGVSWPNPRFTDNGNGTVTDNLTGLIWLKNANCYGGITWQSALNAANSLVSGQCGLSDGSTAGNWRLPTRTELLSLVDFSQYNPPFPSGYPFTNVQTGMDYWSSTTYAGHTPDAWIVSLADGLVSIPDKSNSLYVLPVRGGQVGNMVTLAISRAGTGSGTVTSSDNKINCGGTCSASYNQSISTTLTAWSASGSSFTGWSGGGCSGTGSCTLNASGSATVTATFTQNLPGAATLVSPTGTTTTTPTYWWNAVSNAAQYYLWVNDSTGNVIKTWYTAAQAGCASGSGSASSTCSITPSATLATGSGTWWVMASNSNGAGPWSTGMAFTVSIAPPGAATLVLPTGTLTTTTPTYTWNAVSNAAQYYLWVNDSTGNVIKTWYTAAQANCSTGTGTCSITPSTALASGAGTWWILPWNSNGNGPWSDGMAFIRP
jgi:hypothetical protein